MCLKTFEKTYADVLASMSKLSKPVKNYRKFSNFTVDLIVVGYLEKKAKSGQLCASYRKHVIQSYDVPRGHKF